VSDDRVDKVEPLRALVPGYDICDNCGGADMEWGYTIHSGRFVAVFCVDCGSRLSAGPGTPVTTGTYCNLCGALHPHDDPNPHQCGILPASS
jgi:hypothetical protein